MGRVEVLTHPGLAGRRRVFTFEHPLRGSLGLSILARNLVVGTVFISILQEGNGGSEKLETWGLAR